MQEPVPSDRQDSEFLDALKKGVFIGAALLMLVVPPWKMHQQEQQREEIVGPATSAMGAGSAVTNEA
ncbi:MAG: hypothetical protein JWP22_3797, partial [Ramlibacter sp.]|nr:hypothetical protein [Ramlibacter sp.]